MNDPNARCSRRHPIAASSIVGDGHACADEAGRRIASPIACSACSSTSTASTRPIARRGCSRSTRRNLCQLPRGRPRSVRRLVASRLCRTPARRRRASTSRAAACCCCATRASWAACSTRFPSISPTTATGDARCRHLRGPQHLRREAQLCRARGGRRASAGGPAAGAPQALLRLALQRAGRCATVSACARRPRTSPSASSRPMPKARCLSATFHGVRNGLDELDASVSIGAYPVADVEGRCRHPLGGASPVAEGHAARSAPACAASRELRGTWGGWRRSRTRCGRSGQPVPATARPCPQKRGPDA